MRRAGSCALLALARIPSLWRRKGQRRAASRPARCIFVALLRWVIERLLGAIRPDATNGDEPELPILKGTAPRAPLGTSTSGRAARCGKSLSLTDSEMRALPGSIPHQRHLRQASLWQIRHQDVRQIRPDPAPGDNHQRRLRLQAPPQRGTSEGPGQPCPRPGQEDHLQPQRSARASPRLQSPLPRLPLRPR
jgi:hypothetical protein